MESSKNPEELLRLYGEYWDLDKEVDIDLANKLVDTVPTLASLLKAVNMGKEMLEVQGRRGTWDYDEYMFGMYNGMEYMLSLIEGRNPVYRDKPSRLHKLVEFDCLITNGMPFHDRSITGRLEKGWKVVTCIPAKLIHPHASEHDMATIFSRYTPYPKDENELPDAPPVKVDLLDTKLEKFDIDEVLEASAEECMTCEGSGVEPHSHDACSDCEGTGEEGKPIKDMTILELAQMLEDGIINSGLLDGNMSVREYLKNYL